MLTIRHIENHTPGYELIHPVHHVWKDREYPGTVFAKTDKEDPLRFECGTLYVMNENAKTIAIYYLDNLNA